MSLKTDHIGTFKHDKMKRPYALCVDDKNQIYVSVNQDVSDCHDPDYKILVFDAQMKFLREFSSNADNISDMKIDNGSGKSLIYISDYLNNKIIVLESETGTFVRAIKIDAPCEMQFSDDKLHVISQTMFSVTTEGKLDKILKGSNCIFMLNKITLEIMGRILLQNLLQPTGLCLDSNNFNVITTGYDVDDDHIVSKTPFLFIIDQKGVILTKVELKSTFKLNRDSMVFDANKVYLLDDCTKSMIILE